MTTTIDQLPQPAGKFSRIRSVPIGTASLLFVSGMTAGGQAPYDTKEQTRIVFDRIQALLNEHGAELTDVMKVTVFLTDIREYGEYNAVRNRVFEACAEPPASSAVEAKLGAPEVRVEIEAIAVVNTSARTPVSKVQGN